MGYSNILSKGLGLFGQLSCLILSWAFYSAMSSLNLIFLSSNFIAVLVSYKAIPWTCSALSSNTVAVYDHARHLPTHFKVITRMGLMELVTTPESHNTAPLVYSLLRDIVSIKLHAV